MLLQIDEGRKGLHDILFNNLSKVIVLVIPINFSLSIHIFHILEFNLHFKFQ